MADGELRDRLAYAIKIRKAKSAWLARACGVSAASVADWLSGKTKSLSGSSLIKASLYLRVDSQWLQTGVGNKPVDDGVYCNNAPMIQANAMMVGVIVVDGKYLPAIDGKVVGEVNYDNHDAALLAALGHKYLGDKGEFARYASRMLCMR